ncbi:unnamed protein product [Brachionus calyciflorus]|uniref:ATP-dependent DNA helicase n=1 Tax=Brachionus calyciflorus TaxID=104777 RepID=A0A814CFR9_9BILA|nr:unnamed protein product [Brachionus calyciflorus]
MKPSFQAVSKSQTKNQTEVEKYFQCRIVSTVGASALIMDHHLVQSTIKVSYDELLCSENITKTYAEECLTRDLIDFNEYDSDLMDNKVSSSNDLSQTLDLWSELFRAKKDMSEINRFENRVIFDDIILDEDENGEKDGNIGLDIEIPNSLKELKNNYEKLTNCQKEVADFVEKNCESNFLIFISGPAGTGKSFILKYLYEMLTMNGFKVAKLATTGLTANLIKGETVHGFFQIDGNYDISLEAETNKWNEIK